MTEKARDSEDKRVAAGALTTIVPLLIAHLLGDFYGSFYGPIVPHLRDRLGLTLTMTGGLAAVYMATSNFLQPAFGILALVFGLNGLGQNAAGVVVG